MEGRIQPAKALFLVPLLAVTWAVPSPAAETPPAAAERPGAEGPSSAGSAATQLAAMRAWHVQYRSATAPLRAALGALVARLARGDARRMGAICRRLAAGLAAVAGDRALAPPDFASGIHLRRAMAALERGAAACLAGRQGELIHHLEEAGGALGNAALALRRYGLRP